MPRGAFLVVSPFFMECSQAEPDPFHGTTPDELRACVDAAFGLLTSFEMRIDGRRVDVSRTVVTTPAMTIPADNLLGPDATLTMNKGYFLALAPLGSGTHHVTASWGVASWDLGASLDITLTVR